MTAGVRGFTLVEMMVSVAIFSFFTLMVLTGTTAVNRLKNVETSHLELMNSARLAMEKLVGGPGLGGTRDGISEARGFTITGGGDTLQYTLPDGVQRQVEEDQGRLLFSKPGVAITMYDPNGANPPSANDSTDLWFTQLGPDVLQIDLVLGKLNRGRWHYASVSTCVTLRN